MHRYIARIAIAVFVIYWLVLFLLTHLPPTNNEGGMAHGDKLAHWVAYALLAWLAALVWRKWVGESKWGYLAVLLGCACYGAFDELTQGFVGRKTDLFDWLADMAGVTMGLLVFHWSYPRVEQSVKRWLAKRGSPPADR